MVIEMFSMIRNITGEKTVEIEAATIEEALIKLGERYDERFRQMIFSPETGLQPGVIVLCRGKNMNSPERLSLPVGKKETVSLFSGIEGG